MLQTMEEPIRS